ncbi:MAG TPA: hypothetical protein VFY45_15295 [Baekduia sp.]|nr:hypothetical protein [Baekduia sp.]
MPKAAASTDVDSLFVRATFGSVRHPFAIRPGVLDDPSEWTEEESLTDICGALLALHEIIRHARAMGSPVPRSGISEEGIAHLGPEAMGEYQGPSYRVARLHKGSPLTVVLQIPPAAAIAFGFALVALAEHVVTSPARLDKRLARLRRDAAAYERERQLIDSGQLDQALKLLRAYPLPDRIEIVGGGEDFEEAEPTSSP